MKIDDLLRAADIGHMDTVRDLVDDAFVELEQMKAELANSREVITEGLFSEVDKAQRIGELDADMAVLRAAYGEAKERIRELEAEIYSLTYCQCTSRHSKIFNNDADGNAWIACSDCKKEVALEQREDKP